MHSKRMVTVFVMGSVLASAAFFACGDDGTAVNDDSDASTGDASGGGGSDSGGGTDTGSSGSNEGGADSGKDGASDAGADARDAGPTDPGQVRCGATSCTVASQSCCVQFDGGTSCSAGASCGGAIGNFRCDEAADCTTPGQVCCGTIGIAGATAECVAAAGCQGGTQRVLCKGPGECPGTQQCVINTFGGRTIGTCED
jgi:hypothetical protein